MSHKKVELKHDQLLDARKKALDNQQFGKIRAHGKLWGMDVFSWANPAAELVAPTIESFPYPVIWIGNQDLLDWCSENFPTVCVNVKTIIAQDQAYEVYSKIDQFPVEKMVGAGSVENSLSMMKELATKGAIVLFTATGVEWERSQKVFVDFLNLHQLK